MADRQNAAAPNVSARDQKEASVAKVFSGQMVMRATESASQMLGTIGYTGQNIIEKLYRDARHVAIVEGSEATHKEIIFASMLRRGGYQGESCMDLWRRAWSAAQIKGACRGNRPQAAATSSGEVVGAVVELTANTTLPGRTATSRTALASPAQGARISRPAAQPISAMPLAKTIASRAGRAAGTKGKNSPGRSRWSAPLPANRAARHAGAARRTWSNARPDIHENLRPEARRGPNDGSLASSFFGQEESQTGGAPLTDGSTTRRSLDGLGLTGAFWRLG